VLYRSQERTVKTAYTINIHKPSATPSHNSWSPFSSAHSPQQQRWFACGCSMWALQRGATGIPRA